MFLGTRSIRTGFVMSLLCWFFLFFWHWETGFMVPFVQLEDVKKILARKV